MKDLTKNQRKVLLYIIRTVKNYGSPPTNREIAQYMTSPDKTASHQYISTVIAALEQKGYLVKRRKNASRNIMVVEK